MLKGLTVWRPLIDTFQTADAFCANCEYVRKLSNGVKVSQCKGREINGTGGAVTELPASFADHPLRGYKLVEVFSGVPDRGGARLSQTFEEAGGEALRYDLRGESPHDFMKYDEFWKEQKRKPAHWYHMAFPCTDFSIARQSPTPSTRSRENPYGDEKLKG